MTERTALEQLRGQRFFANWDEFVSPEHVAASEASLQRLIEALLKIGPEQTEKAVRRAVDQCVRRFNKLDGEGWICTIEREDICEQIDRVVQVCGFDCAEDWFDERDW